MIIWLTLEKQGEVVFKAERNMLGSMDVNEVDN